MGKAADPAIDVSVVIPVYKRLQYLEQSIQGVLDQRFDGAFEVIVVISADQDDGFPVVVDDPLVRVLKHVPRLSTARARNRGIAVARGRDLAFTDADAVADEDWLTNLKAESQGGLCVAGAVLNGTPESVFGTAEYLVEFLDLHPSRPSRTAWHGALCNLFVPKEVWETELPFDESWMAGEDTELTSRLHNEGRFRFSSTPRVTHINRTTFLQVLKHQYLFGRSAAQLGRRSDYKWRALVRYTVLAPIAAAGRIVSVYARAFAWLKGERLRALMISPIVVLLLVVWGWGLFSEGLRLDIRRIRGVQERRRLGQT